MSNPSPFPQRWLPYLLLAPQLAITLVFFVWPTYEALSGAFYRADPFGLSRHFAGLGNFTALFADPGLPARLRRHRAVRGGHHAGCPWGWACCWPCSPTACCAATPCFRTLFIWPYAVAPAIAGALWMFMFAPQVGPGTRLLVSLGIQWNYTLHGNQAMLLVIALTAWQQIAYNFLFFTAGLQGVPASMLEAAALDGAGPVRRFWDVTFPLLAPTTFFLLVMNTLYVFFDTFGVIHIVTQGGPANATTTLVYKLYEDGFQNLNLGSAAAQSIILMALVGLLTVFQFRHLDRKVHYQ